MNCPKCKHPMVEQNYVRYCLNCGHIEPKPEKEWDSK